MQSYRLKSNVRACIDGAILVFLDLRRDRYRAVSVENAPRIAGLTEGAGRASASEASLLALDLIEAAGDQTDAIALQRRRAPGRKLVLEGGHRPTTRELASFWAACVWSAHMLRLRRLDQALASLSNRKALAGVGASSAEKAAGLFEHLRPWYPRRRICLFDSLALMRFMLDRGVAPTLVLGVRTAPFAAHCWVEMNDALVSDMSDHCASFTPIAWV